MDRHELEAVLVPGHVPIAAVTDEGLGNTSWVLNLDGAAVVLDPERHPAPYEAAAGRWAHRSWLRRDAPACRLRDRQP